ncbi:hypothetical protein [Mycobacterium sp.]|jgi:hypothetical protein|uniref:hypothetical protein n=1 Tax=Mycobacterium sp. TaxID=1785 RepID=UPI003BB1A06D
MATTRVVTVTPAQRAAARAYIEIMGKDKVNEAVVHLAEAERPAHPEAAAAE